MSIISVNSLVKLFHFVYPFLKVFFSLDPSSGENIRNKYHIFLFQIKRFILSIHLEAFRKKKSNSTALFLNLIVIV